LSTIVSNYLVFILQEVELIHRIILQDYIGLQDVKLLLSISRFLYFSIF